VAVASYQPLNAPLCLKGTALEESGQTSIQVGIALLTFTGSPGSITLGQQNISTLMVKGPNLATTYSRNTDYSSE